MRCLLMSEFFDQGVSDFVRQVTLSLERNANPAGLQCLILTLRIFASLRETTSCRRTVHAKAQSRKGKPQRKTLLPCWIHFAKIASPKKKAISTRDPVFRRQLATKQRKH